jgi:hypothetical protein
VRNVHSQMANHVRPYLASISASAGDGIGDALGSGVYLEVCDRPYLLTCEHVVRDHVQGVLRLGHVLRDGGEYYSLTRPIFMEAEPKDLALMPVSLELWASGDKSLLPVTRIATTHDVAQNELLFLCGYPGVRSRFSPWDATLYSKLIPFTARETELPMDKRFIREFHFALEYPIEKAESVEGNQPPLPSPPGLSGSPVWDTRFVSSGCAENWTPAHARLLGIIWFWDSADSCLVATKAEKVREFLLDELQEGAGSLAKGI